MSLKPLVLIVMTAALTARAGELPRNFAAPPPEARPWVYWFSLNGNLTREGITADLEAMTRVGIGGVLIMEVDQGAPQGPARFRRAAVARAVQARLPRGAPARPGSEHEQRRRLVRQRRAVDHAGAVDAEGRLDRDGRRGAAAVRRRAAAAAGRRRTSIATSPCWPFPTPAGNVLASRTSSGKSVVRCRQHIPPQPATFPVAAGGRGRPARPRSST